ncbi:MAG: hypothetical protein WCJ14_08950 [Verrucomicrobiota bacterium]
MKKGLLILLLALAAGGAAFWVTRTHHQSDRQAVLLDSMPELAWLRGELKLTDSQFTQACTLHTAYRPQCAVMCCRIAEAHARLAALAQGARSVTPELADAIREHARVRSECQQKMLEHLYQTARLFDDRQAARYLAKVLPHALESTTAGPVSCHQD